MIIWSTRISTSTINLFLFEIIDEHSFELLIVNYHNYFQHSQILGQVGSLVLHHWWLHPISLVDGPNTYLDPLFADCIKTRRVSGKCAWGHIGNFNAVELGFSWDPLYHCNEINVWRMVVCMKMWVYLVKSQKWALKTYSRHILWCLEEANSTSIGPRVIKFKTNSNWTDPLFSIWDLLKFFSSDFYN